MKNTDNSPIIITGMHRSGTSLTANLLRDCGVFLGQPQDILLARTEDNPDGYAETFEIVHLNDRILEFLGGSWNTPPLLPINWEKNPALDPFRQEGFQITQRIRSNQDIWGWKDPRTTLLLPFWKTIYPNIKIVVSVRNPIEIALSLNKRINLDNIENYVDFLTALDLTAHYFDALESFSQLHEEYFVVHYERLLENTQAELLRITQALGMEINPRHLESIAMRAKQSYRRNHLPNSLISQIPGFPDQLRNNYIRLSQKAGQEIDLTVHTPGESSTPFLEIISPLLQINQIGFEKMRQIINTRDKNANIAEEHEKIKQTLSNEIKKKEALEAQLEDTIREKKTNETQLFNEIQKRKSIDSRLSEANQQKQAIELQLTQEHKRVQQLEDSITQKDSQFNNLQSEYYSILFAHQELQDSFAFGVINRFRLAIEKLAPQNSLRRRIYSFLIRGLKYFQQNGLRGVIKRIFRRKKSSRPKQNPQNLIQENPPAHFEKVYLSLIESNEQNREMDQYVEIMEDHFDGDPDLIKLIAFYLPQFHPIPENDAWWGKGFTEWTNVSKAVPQFVGQYQPHLPGELGFYDLRVPDVQERQVELAKQYGIHGFCFYYYWFDGKRLLEKPLDSFMANPNIDFPFCICWANENWTRRWDGYESDVLIGQNHSPESDLKFIKDITPILQHKNYIQIGGKPLIIVYRCELLPDVKETVTRWRQHCRESGIGEIHLVAAQTFGFTDPTKVGFDAAVEFPPHNVSLQKINDSKHILNANYEGQIFDYGEIVQKFSLSVNRNVDFPVYKAIFPSWDNEPRRPGRGYTFANTSLDLYKQWLRQSINFTLKRRVPGSQLVFINAWNEWAEGAHLEPDRKFGYAYLQATYDILREAHKSVGHQASLIKPQPSPHTTITTNKIAIIVHAFYPDIWEEIADYLANLDQSFDLFISIPEDQTISVGLILSKFPDAHIIKVNNVGRDIAPFLEVLSKISPLNYSYICKLHTKKTEHRNDGDIWRNDVYQKLVGNPDQVSTILELLDDPKIGMVGPYQHVLPVESFWGENLETVENLASDQGVNFSNNFLFIAGSMFWFKPEALLPLHQFQVDKMNFGRERGYKDGTLAHAIERYFGLLAHARGFRIVSINSDGRVYTSENSKQRENYQFAARTSQAAYSNGNPGKDPILVCQVGQAGALPVFQSLRNTYKKSDHDVQIFYANFLQNPEKVKVPHNADLGFPNSSDDLSITNHSQDVRNLIRQNPQMRWKIVSMVQEPISLNILAFIDNLHQLIPDWEERYLKNDLPMEELLETFLHQFKQHHSLDNWFEQELKSFFDINVYDIPFPTTKGYKIFYPAQKADLLIIRSEDLKQVSGEVFEKFLGIKNFNLKYQEFHRQTEHHELYKAFQTIKLPPDYVNGMINLKSTQHFYSDEELEMIKQQWSKVH